MMSGGNFAPNYSTYNRNIPQMPTTYLLQRQNDYNQQPQPMQPETIINNVLKLDGEVIYQNQERVKAKKGYSFGNPIFAR